MLMKLNQFLFFLLLSSLQLPAQKSDMIIGTYLLPNNLEVEIYKHGPKYEGKITSVEGFHDGQTRDYKNPNRELRNDLLIGKVIIHDLEYDTQKNDWINGKMYGPGKGLIFNLEVTEILTNEIEVVGSKFFFWKTMKWKKK